MNEGKFIDPARPLSPGLDYVALRKRGLDRVQALAWQSWTDYNEHDPGVTILELLCYALTEISYRAELPIEDLLSEPGTNAIDPMRQGLVPPRDILPCNPLTANDYRKLIVDRVPGVANAWLREHEGREPGAVNGLYEIDLYVPAGASSEPDRHSVIDDVRRTYVEARSLCEDVHEIRLLDHMAATLTAQIALAPSAKPERVIAHMLYRAGCVLAPELRRDPLDTMLAAGRTPAALFSGPLLHRGFISDAQLEPRRERFTIGEITQALREVDGVAGVIRAGVAIDGAWMDTNGGPTALVVPDGSILRLDARPVNGGFGIRLVRNDVECRPNPDVVQQELTRLWADHRRTHDTLAQCARLLPFPKGTAVDTRAYHSIQHQFPAIYGVNAYGVRSDDTIARRAQARQLKAYLLVFEQLLADGFARLAHATRVASRDTVYPYLDGSVPDAAELFAASYRSGVRTLESRDRAAGRLTRTRESMLATYAEVADPIVRPFQAGTPRVHSAEDAPGPRGEVDLLRHLTRISAGRGTGCDYAAPPTPEPTGGFEIRTRLQLGFPATPPRPLDETLRGFGLAPMREAPAVADREPMLRHAQHIGRAFTPIAHWALGLPATPQGPPSEALRAFGLAPMREAGAEPDREPPVHVDDVTAPPALRHREEMSEELLVAAAHPGQYRIGRLPGEDTRWTVVCRAPSQPLWQLVGIYDDTTSALTDAARLLSLARVINGQARRLYVVEHALLRFAPPDPVMDFAQSFTMSAVVCVPVREAGDPDYRRRVCDVLRRNTPAHIVVHGCFLRLSRLSTFEALYWTWREALHHRTGREDACRHLRDFLRSDLS